MDTIDERERGRKSYVSRAWMDAYGSLSYADQVAPIGAEDLELLARSAYMLGRDDEYVSCLERAHHTYLHAGEAPRAVRCAFWIGHNLLFRSEMSPALGWFARAQRLLERECAYAEPLFLGLGAAVRSTRLYARRGAQGSGNNGPGDAEARLG